MKRKSEYGRVPRLSPLTIAVALALAAGDSAWALPQGEQVVAGQVSVGRPAAGSMLMQQGSPAAIVNWRGFSIDPGEAVRIRQPDASSVMLNRVVGEDPSRIFGQLSANGRVFLVNPNGVLFAAGASVDVGSIVASTLGIGDADFLAGRYRFAGAGGSVVNQGTITAAERGAVALLGGSVRNDGTINAKLGTVALGAGAGMTLDLAGDGLSNLVVTQGALDAQVTNGGAIVADGGMVVLTAQALNALAGTAVNHGGIVRARSLVEHEGRIVLDGGDGGTTLVSGTLDATGAVQGTRGGNIQVLGTQVGVFGTAVVDASGPAGGGAVLVGGDFQGGNRSVRNATATFVGADAALHADATSNGDGGRVIVWSTEATRAHGALSARGGPQGGNGGLVETSGHFLDTAGARVSAAAPAGQAGQWLLDPADITIVSGLTGSTLNAGGPPAFSSQPTGPATVTDTAIATALTGGTNVSVKTSAPSANNPGFGDLLVDGNANVQYTGAGARTLTLSAHRNIVIQGGARLEAVATAGPLSLDLDAGLVETGGSAPPTSGSGFINIGAATINTNGGGVRMYGQSDPVNGFAEGQVIAILGASILSSPGVSLLGTKIDTGVGSVSVRGVGLNGTAGVVLDNGAQITTTTGAVSLVGRGGRGGTDLLSTGTGETGGSGVVVSGGSALQSASGALTLAGVGGDGALAAPATAGNGGAGGSGLAVAGGPGPALQSVSGAVTLIGTGGAGALAGTGAGVSGGNGGNGGSGLAISGGLNPALQSVSGTLSLTGTAGAGGSAGTGAGGSGGNGGSGIAVSAGANAALQSASGAMSLTGTGGAGGLAGTGAGGSGGNGGSGVAVSGGANAVLQSASGALTLTGSGGAGGSAAGSGAAGSGGDGGSGVAVFGGPAAVLHSASGTMTLIGSGGAGASGAVGPNGSDSGSDGGFGGPGGTGGTGVVITGRLGGPAPSSVGNLTVIGTGGAGGSGGAGGNGSSGFNGDDGGPNITAQAVEDGGAGGAGGLGGQGGSGGAGVTVNLGDFAAASAASVRGATIAIDGRAGAGGNGGRGGNGGPGGSPALTGIPGAGGKGGASGSPGLGGIGLLAVDASIDAIGPRLSMIGRGAAAGSPGPGGTGGAGGAAPSATGGRGGDGGSSNAPFDFGAGLFVGRSTLLAPAGDINMTATSGTGAAAGVAGLPGAGGTGQVVGLPGTTGTVNGGQLGGDGMRLFFATLDAGNVRLTGITQEATAPSPAQRGNSGVILDRTTVNASQGVDIRGIGSAGSGVIVGSTDQSSRDRVTSDSGRILITGQTSGAAPGVVIYPPSSFSELDAPTLGGPNQRSDIVLRASNNGTTDSIVLHDPRSFNFDRSLSVSTSGTLVLAPGALSPDASAFVAADAVPINVGTSSAGGFELDLGDLLAIRPAKLVVGTNTHAGAITVAAANPSSLRDDPIAYDLTLQNEAPGSRGITLQAGLSAAGRTVALATGGPLTSVGPIVADALQVRGGAQSNVFLLNPANAVNTLAVDPPAVFSFVNGGQLQIGRVTASGFSTAGGPTNGVVQTTVENSRSLGNFTVQTLNGPITLNQSITTLEPNSNITLAAASIFTNPGNSTLTPGAGGRWRVWADTWEGENRGGLAPTTPRPNFYGCVFGAPACASGVTLPAAGSRFIYAKQPALVVTADDKTRTYGAANPPLTATVTGLVANSGDVVADVVDVVLGTSAQPSSPVRGYAIDVSGTSPVGYTVTPVPAGTLTVQPAPLTVRADDKTRLYGADNPHLTRTVTGLVLGETEAVITGGLPTTTAVPTTPVAAQRPIVIGDASADNYKITRVDGTMKIEPTPLTVIANNQTRLEGTANPPLTATFVGLVAGDTPEVAQPVGFTLATRGNGVSAAGTYQIEIEPTPLVLANYVVTPVPGILTVVRRPDPTWVPLPPPEIYSAICTASGTPELPEATQGSDFLSLEWSRVRHQPNLRQCTDIGQRNGCSDF